MDNLPMDILLHVCKDLSKWDVLQVSQVNKTLRNALGEDMYEDRQCIIKQILPIRSRWRELLEITPLDMRDEVKRCALFPCKRTRVRRDEQVLPNRRLGFLRYAFRVEDTDLEELGDLLWNLDIPIATMTILSTDMFDHMIGKVLRFVTLGTVGNLTNLPKCPELVHFHHTNLETAPAGFWDTFAGTAIFNFFDAHIQKQTVHGILCYKQGTVVAATRSRWTGSTTIDKACARAVSLDLNNCTPPKDVVIQCTTLKLQWTTWVGFAPNLELAIVCDCETYALRPAQAPALRRLYVRTTDLRVQGFLQLEELMVNDVRLTAPVSGNPKLHTLRLDTAAMPHTGPGNDVLQEILIFDRSANHVNDLPTRHTRERCHMCDDIPCARTTFTRAIARMY